MVTSKDEKDLGQQILSNGLRTAIIDIDLQFYKGSIYKLRWGSPGGLDEALPCYRSAASVVGATPWPAGMRDIADQLAARVQSYILILEAQDVTSASAQHSVMMANFEALKEYVRNWP